jgi:hypothetical protein
MLNKYFFLGANLAYTEIGRFFWRVVEEKG